VYEKSALKAMAWAEADFARQCREKSKTADNLRWTVRDSRNLAAIEMLRVTGDRKWHDLFMLNTVLTADNPNLFAWGKAVQGDAAFAYAIADRKLTDPAVRARAVQGLEAMARSCAVYADGNAFDIVCNDKGRPMFMGLYSTPWCGHVALRAYHVTGNKQYLALGIRACQFSSGANPDNLTFTTGLGANPIRNALKLDAQSTGQPVPEGITVYGIEDHVNYPSTWSYWILPSIDSVMSPHYMQWPLTESYVDTNFFIVQNEFTTDIWDEGTWTWGYLAARPGQSR
jgi:endoglucanase